MALEGVRCVLQGGAGVPVGGKPGGADSDEDGESEDLHVILSILLIMYRSNNLFCEVFIPFTAKTRVSLISHCSSNAINNIYII